MPTETETVTKGSRARVNELCFVPEWRGLTGTVLSVNKREVGLKLDTSVTVASGRVLSRIWLHPNSVEAE